MKQLNAFSLAYPSQPVIEASLSAGQVLRKTRAVIRVTKASAHRLIQYTIRQHASTVHAIVNKLARHVYGATVKISEACQSILYYLTMQG